MNDVKTEVNNAESHSVARPIAVLTASIATLGVNSLGFGPIASRIAADLGVTVPHIMMAAGSYGIGTALGALFLSFLIDRRGSRTSLAGSLFIVALAFVLSAVSPNTAWLIAVQGIAGLAAGVALPAIYTFAAQIAPRGRESAILGRVLFGWTISMVAGVVVVTTVAELAHWRWVFGFLAVVAASAFGMVLRMADAGDSGMRGVGPVAARPSPLTAARIPGVMPLLVACFAIMTTFYGTYGYLGDHIHHALARPLTATGLLAMMYGLGFGMAAFGDHYIDRFGVRRVIPWCFALLGLIYGGLGLASASYVGLVLASFLWGVLNHFALNLVVAGLSAIDPVRRGSILGLNSAVTYVAASTGVIIFGPVYTFAGFQTVALVSAVFMVAAAGFLGIWFARRTGTSREAI